MKQLSYENWVVIYVEYILELFFYVDDIVFLGASASKI